MNNQENKIQNTEAEEKTNSHFLLGQFTAEHYFSGPLPPPAVVEKYEKILPGSAERIFKIAEEQSRHRMEAELKVINSDILDSKLGLSFGFLIGMTGILAGAWVSAKVSSGAGGFISISAIAALAGVFVYGSRQKQQELSAKQDQEDQKQK